MEITKLVKARTEKVAKPKLYRLPAKNAKVCSSCGKFSCKYPFICKAIKEKSKIRNLEKLGFDKSKIGTFEVYDEYFRLQYELYEEYHIKQKTIQIIAEERNFSFQRLAVIFDFLAIPKRTNSEANVLAIQLGRKELPVINGDGGKYKFKHGWHTSWEGEKWYFRSSYEENYMMYLDKQKTHYKGEGYLKIPYYNTQKGRMAVAYPDFYFPDTNTIVEVKSMGTLIGYEQEMNDKFRRYRELGYTAHLLLDHVMYENYKFV